MILERLNHWPVLRAALDQWLNAREPGEQTPLKTGIDLKTFSETGALPHIWLMKRFRASDFRLSFVGEYVRDNFRENPIDKHLRDILGTENAETMNNAIDEITQTPGIHFSSGPVVREGQPGYQGWRMMIPMRSETGGLDWVFGIFVKQDLPNSIENDDKTNYLLVEKYYATIEDLDLALDDQT